MEKLFSEPEGLRAAEGRLESAPGGLAPEPREPAAYPKSNHDQGRGSEEFDDNGVEDIASGKGAATMDEWIVGTVGLLHL